MIDVALHDEARRATASLNEAALLCVERVWKRLGDLEVVRDVSLRVGRGQVVAVLGRSGSGKSSAWPIGQ
jgi:ABC-type histidine transport system ATPase subunit